MSSLQKVQTPPQGHGLRVEVPASTDFEHMRRMAEQAERHDTIRRQRRAAAEIDSLPSMNRAAFWFEMYRRHLYRETPYHDALRAKMEEARAAAFVDLDRVLDEHGLESVFLGQLKHGDAVADHIPYWKDVPRGFEAREKKLHRRWLYWQKRGNADRAAAWRLQYEAVAHLGERSWPLTPKALDRARRWRDSDHGGW